MEQRSAVAKVAAGRLTCFGGKRELDEPALACIERELVEELGRDWASRPRATCACVVCHVAPCF